MSSSDVVRSAAGEDVRDRIYRAAIDVVYEQGFSGASMRDIVARSDVQMASIYYHYSSKQNLLYSIMERTLLSALDFVREKVDAASAQDSAVRLQIALEANIEWHAQWQREAFITDAELSRLDESLREKAVVLRDQHEAIFRRILADGVAQGQMRAEDPSLIARMLLSASGGVSAWYRKGRSHEPKMIAQVLTSAVLTGLRSPGGRDETATRQIASPSGVKPTTPAGQAASLTEAHGDPPTNERIYVAALDHFYRFGYNGAAIRDILEDADAKMSSLYHYFGSKQGLLFAVLKRESEAATTMLEASVSNDGGVVEQLSIAIESHIYWHTAWQREAFVTDAELARLEEPQRSEVVAIRDRHEKVFKDIIDRGIAEGVLSPIETALVVRLLLAGATGVSSWYRPSGRHDASAIARIYSEAMLDGLEIRTSG